MYTLEDIHAVDPEIAAAITAEFDRQNSHIELIASENWVSPAVMSAMKFFTVLPMPTLVRQRRLALYMYRCCRKW